VACTHGARAGVFVPVAKGGSIAAISREPDAQRRDPQCPEESSSKEKQVRCLSI